MESSKSTALGAEVAKVADLVDYQPRAVVSREIVRKPNGTVTVFAFDEGEGLSEHAALFGALVQGLEGKAKKFASPTNRTSCTTATSSFCPRTNRTRSGH